MIITKFEHYGTMLIEGRPLSIFDSQRGGEHDIKGNYYCILECHNTHNLYAVTVESLNEMDSIGRHLEENEEAVFDGNKVRGMTYSEERDWDTGMLMAHVDLWGNVAVDEPFDVEWFYEHCL